MYKNIFVAVQAGALDEELVRFASLMAKGYQASLKIANVGLVQLDVLPMAGFGMGGGIAIPLESPSDADIAAHLSKARNRLAALLSEAGVNASIIDIEGTQMLVDEKLAILARTTDLYVCFNPLNDDASDFNRAAFETVLHQGSCGVYISPCGTVPVAYAKSIVVAWNLSREAARATSIAMPLLAKANEVSVLLVDPNLRHAGDVWQPGDQMLEYLKMHEVRAKLVRVTSADLSVADAIAAELNNKEARLVVMGGYMRNAVADWLLGSVAREFLEKSSIPILMAN